MSTLDRCLLDACADLLLLVDAGDLTIVNANAAVAHALGWPMDALLGKTITDIECDLQDVFYWDEVRQGSRTPLEDQPCAYRCQDGRVLNVRRTVHFLDGPQGRPLCWLLARQDPADLQQVQDVLQSTLSQLRATLESTGNGILVLDVQGNISAMNHPFGQMWALPEELLGFGDDAAILNHVAQSTTEPERVRERFASILGPQVTLDTLTHRDGRVFELSSRPQYLGERVVGRVFSVLDVTQRVRDAQALRESRDRLEARVAERTAELHAANQRLQDEKDRLAALVKELESTQNQLMQSERLAAIGQLAAGVAHEINNPVGFVSSNLGSLQAYVDRMLQLLAVYGRFESELSPSAQQLVRQTQEAVDYAFMQQDVADLLRESQDGLQRVKRIVQDLRNFSHRDDAQPELASVEDGLESTLRVVWNELKYKAEVKREWAGVPKIWCYPTQLNQVFMNLLVNAVQAIEHKGQITVRTGTDDSGVWVQVQDTGCGIAAEHLARIFDPFFTTKPVGQGTGLGLSLSYGIVHKHGGRIDVHSQPGQGTTFTVWLPLAGPVAAAAAGSDTPPQPPQP